MKSKGLGDTIEKITSVTGIKKVVDAVSKVTKKPCGCIDKVANGIAKAVGKKDCGCKKRAQQLDNVQNKLTNMFQGNKNK